MKIFTIIAYKSFANYVCRGHRMDSHGSELEIHQSPKEWQTVQRDQRGEARQLMSAANLYFQRYRATNHQRLAGEQKKASRSFYTDESRQHGDNNVDREIGPKVPIDFICRVQLTRSGINKEM